MLPTIAPGVAVTIDCGRPFGAGDVIAFNLAGQVLVHRIELVSHDGTRLLTRGDNRVVPDLPISQEAVIGVVLDVPPPPESLRRRIVLGVCRRPFEHDPGRCRRLVHALRIAGAVISFGPRRVRQLARIEPPAQ